MIRVIVKHRDGTETKGEVWASTEVAFERKFGLAWAEGFAKEHPYQEYVYFTAFHAIQEAGRTGLSFDDWLKTISNVDIEADDPNPPSQAPQPGSSAPSQ